MIIENTQSLKIAEYFPSSFKKISITGTVNFDDELIIEGEFNGTLKGGESSVLVITPGASVEGNISCKRILNEGFLSGTIRTQKIVVMTLGSISGDLHCRDLAVEEGARLNCRIQTSYSDF